MEVIRVIEEEDFEFCVLCGWGDAIKTVDIPNHGQLILCRRHWTPEKFEKTFNKQGKLFYKELPSTIEFEKFMDEKRAKENLKIKT